MLKMLKLNIFLMLGILPTAKALGSVVFKPEVGVGQ